MLALSRALASAALLIAGAVEAQEPRFTGAPRIGSEEGWSIKPRGRLQLDIGQVSGPARPGLNGELRRAQLGFEGTAPGRFSFLFEAEFAEGIAEITEATISWAASDRLALTIGQHNNFQSLEELSSDRFTTFMERAAFTDAFGFERRIGASATFTAGDLAVQAGAFGDNLRQLDEADGVFSLDARIVYAPAMGNGRLHLGGSAHWRDNGDRAANGVTTAFSVRPLLHADDTRFVRTPARLVDRERRFGLEAALIQGPFHVAAEASWLHADAIGADPDDDYFGGYAEVGWFLTGESRGYRGGRWERTRVRRPVEAGGFGALQANLRYDRLDLGTGGSQDALIAALVWIPTDYLRFAVNYARIDVSGGAIPDSQGRRDYAADMVGARAQFDF